MLKGKYDGAIVRWSALVLAIVAFSPVPLIIPSGIALATIGCAGGAVLLVRYRQRTPAVVPVRRGMRT